MALSSTLVSAIAPTPTAADLLATSPCKGLEAGCIDTYAGGGDGDGMKSKDAVAKYPSGLAVSPAGDIFFSDDLGTEGGGGFSDDRGANRVRRVERQGRVVAAAFGDGSIYPDIPEDNNSLLHWLSARTGDGGPAVKASFRGPAGLAFDRAGNAYVADRRGHRVRKVDLVPTSRTYGMISTVAGTGMRGYSGDGGPAKDARLNTPDAVAVDDDGDLYIAELFNHRVRKVDAATGVITTYVGGGLLEFSGESGPATEVDFYPLAVAVHGSPPVLYVTEFSGHRVVKVVEVDGRPVMSVYAGTGDIGFSGDGGPARQAQLSFAQGIAVDRHGALYIADQGNHRVRRVSPGDEVITTYVAEPAYDCSTAWSHLQPTPPAAACSVRDVAMSDRGELYFTAEGVNNDPGSLANRERPNSWHIRRVNPEGAVENYVGSGWWSYCCDGKPATTAGLNYPAGVVVDGAGNLFVADQNNHRVRRIDAATGVIETVAGSGACSYDRFSATAPAPFDGRAVDAVVCAPADVALDSAGNLYIAEELGSRIRMLDRKGTITTVAGTGTHGFSGDGGPATKTNLNRPKGVALDGAGNLYIADTTNDRVRRIDKATGIITTVVGTGERVPLLEPRVCPAAGAPIVGDGLAATAARLTCPQDILIDERTGSLYIADTANQRIRKVDRGKITTIAGTGLTGYSGDGGPAIAARIFGPDGLALDERGELYFADRQNSRVRKISASGTITTVAGRGYLGSEWFILNAANHGGFSGDGGRAVGADLRKNKKVALGPGGKLYIADTWNDRIRVVQL